MTDRRTLKLTNPPMTGDDVREMQALINLGLGIVNSKMAADGVFGPITENHLSKFQCNAKLRVDGVCGPKTWAALDAGCRNLENRQQDPDDSILEETVRPVYACTTSDKTLRIDDETALWLMRMVAGEGGLKCSTRKTSALLWAIINRWLLWPGADNYGDFVDMLRAFSQPINPRWQYDGDLAKKYNMKGPASPARLQRRAEICAMNESIPPAIRENVKLFSFGKLSYPDLPPEMEGWRISNWASLESTPTLHPWGIRIGGDWFFEDTNLRDGEVFVR